MRMLDRSAMHIPNLLDSPQAETFRAEIQEYIESTYQKGGQRRAPEFSRLFRDDKFLKTVSDNFHGTCAFCETSSNGYNVEWVEHYRPMELASDESGSTSLLHYVWLALDWENIYWCCPTCARAKENKFFVKQSRGAVHQSVQILRNTEQELLIDPCYTNPLSHLDFGPLGLVDGYTSMGATTVETFRLNREELVNARRRTIQSLAGALNSNPKTVFASPKTSTNIRGFTALEWRLDNLSESSSLPLSHIGSSTWAVLSWVKTQGIAADNPHVFLEQIQELDKEARNKLLMPLIEGETDQARQTGAYTPTGSVESNSHTPSRIAKLQELPLSDNFISQVTIRNFKALKEISFTLPHSSSRNELSSNNALDFSSSMELAPCMLVLGENATGKSSVLEALTLALLGTSEIGHLDQMLNDENLQPDGMIHRPDVNNWDVLSDQPLSVEILYQDSSEKTELVGMANSGSYFGNPKPSKIVLSYGPRRFFKKQSQRRFRAPAYRVRSQFDPLATIPNPALWLLRCNQGHFDAAVRALREILMLHKGQDVIRENGKILIDTDGGRIPLSEMSVGYKSIIAMATDIIRELFYHYDNTEYAHAIVLIDEIETHLHPRWKMRIMRLLRQAFPKIQFIVTTHDPLCVRGMYDGEVFVLQRSSEDARIETLTDLPSIRGMRAEQLLTSEFFGLGTTDPETDAKLSRYHTLVAKKTRSDTEEIELENLSIDINQNMVVGNTIGEQIIVEAMREVGFDPVAPIEKVTDKLKKDMLAKALAVFDAKDTPSQ